MDEAGNLAVIRSKPENSIRQHFISQEAVDLLIREHGKHSTISGSPLLATLPLQNGVDIRTVPSYRGTTTLGPPRDFTRKLQGKAE